MATPELVILDDDRPLREILVLYFSLSTEITCRAYASLDQMETDHGSVFGSKVALLDIELGADEPSGIDVYRWLMNNGYPGKIFFLTGHGNMHPGVKEAMGLNAAILEKPISGDDLINIVGPIIHSQKTAQGR